jgi:trk system potassium uptake protein
MAEPSHAVPVRQRLEKAARIIQVASGPLSLALLVAVVGWEHPPSDLVWIEAVARSLLAVFGVMLFARLALTGHRLIWLRRRWPYLVLGVVALAQSVGFDWLLVQVLKVFPQASTQVVMLGLVALTQLPVLVDAGLRTLRLHEFFAERRVSPGVVLMLTFGVLIIAGMLLLKMPRATTAGISWLNALFTATSAVCVTGLLVVDTETAFTPTGHTILLMLIQLGGLGVMTLTTFLAALFGNVSLRGRVMLLDLLSEENLGRIGRTLPVLIVLTFVCEALGAWALHGAIGPGAEERGGRIFVAVFHSVSAFCNAGFSTWSAGLCDPLVRTSVSVQAIIMGLIVAGGMGFPVLYATGRWLWAKLAGMFVRNLRLVRLGVHARVAWVTTLALIAGGALLIGVAEFAVGGRPHETPAVLAALFHSITARTAGFNIVPTEALTPATVGVLVLLMFVGGCPGSTAGGVKTTAFAVGLLNVRRILLGRRDAEVFGRRLSEEVVSRALAVLSLSFTWVACASILLAVLEPAVPLADLVFETVSALSTVGLTRGVTPTLGPAAKIVLVLTMFAGRVGVLYFVFAFFGRRRAVPYRLPEDNVHVT